MGDPYQDLSIAFVYDAVYPWEKGGAQKRIWELARRLADDHDVHLYGMHYWDGPSQIEREGVTIHGVCEPYELYTNGRRSIPQAIKFATAVSRPLFANDFDVIDCQEFPYFPVFPSKIHELSNSSTLVVTWYEVWDDYWYEYLGWKGAFGKVIERVTTRLGTEIVPISDHIATDLHSIGRTDGLSVVPNGVDYDRLQEIPATDADWDVIYVGRLSEHKNVDVLLEAISLIAEDREVRCGVIGDGPERGSLEKYASELDVENHVEFLGFVEADEDVIGNIKAADVFVLPSEREGFPNTILEANACGVPSVVIDHPENGARAVVADGETGYVTDLSAEAVADRVEVLLSDEETRRRMSENARAFGQDHDWNVIVDRLEGVYRDVLERRDA